MSAQLKTACKERTNGRAGEPTGARPELVLATGESPRAPRPEIEQTGETSLWPLAKRVFDVALSLLLLVAMIPLFAVIALAIKLDSPGPVFYRVRRVGHRGRPLMMLKFRKMHDDASGGPLTTSADPRLTRVGSLLTATRLDELPQLWDVFRGRMSIVGPRPEDPRFVALRHEDYGHILSIRPGLTGLGQLAYAGERDILDEFDPVGDYVRRILPQKLILDTLYANRSGLLLDLAVLRWTIVAVLFGKPVAVSRKDGKMNVRRRPATRTAPQLTVEPAFQTEG